MNHRRNFIRIAGAATIAATAARVAPVSGAQQQSWPQSQSGLVGPLIATQKNLLPKNSAKPRVVIVGGSWGGLTAARYLRTQYPAAEVVVLERNPVFWSCPMSNQWLAGVVESDFIMHDLNRPANRYGFSLIQADVVGIDRDRRIVYSSQGVLDYDFLILAAGIRNAYEEWFGEDQRAALYTRQNFPAAYIANNEHLLLKQKLQQFKGGNFVMNLPPPPHRCPPSPYERACTIAWYMKTNRIPGKLIVLDPKPRINPIHGGFNYAFKELYGDIIEYVPDAEVRSVDPFKQQISTTAGDFDFEDAVLMPPHQAADIVWQAGLIREDPPTGPAWWGHQHPTLLHAVDDDRVYLIGDCMGFVSPDFGYYPKSAHVANQMGRIAAGYIAQRLQGEEPAPVLPDNLCYMMIQPEPLQVVAVEFDYAIGSEGHIQQTQVDIDNPFPELVAESFEWARSTWADFL